MTFDQLKPNRILRGPLFAEPVEVIVTLPMGAAVKLVGRGVQTGKVVDIILTQEKLNLLETTPDTEPFDGDAKMFRLGIEAMRLQLAFEYDPYFSLSIARVDPLPHQLEAVYDFFLRLPRIRFLLADDPGAGKTIMAGLLLKEMKIRGLVKRTLIITPASLSFQWQREMKDKFRENFEVVRSDILRANYGSNPWQDKNQVVTSVSWVSRIDDAKESLLRSHWDLIIVDEAHKMSASSRDKKTLAYQLGEALSQMTEEGVVGADAIFACLGPALEIFSRYSRVEKASGEPVPLKEYLEQVWAAVAKEALTMIFTGADATGFEEDARLTAMWLWTVNAGKTDAANDENADEEATEDESEGGAKKVKITGFALEYDAARKIAQGLGAHLEDLGSLVEVSGETARLLPVAERARTLFGKDEGKAATVRGKRDPQMDMFKTLQPDEDTQASLGETKVESIGKTVLDRVHQSMILFAASRGEALKRFLVEDGAGNDQRFWRLAQALSALYPISTDEKRWVDGVLARKKGLGF